jgi:hypothetical protein
MGIRELRGIVGVWGLDKVLGVLKLLSLCRVIGKKERLREASLAAKLKGPEILVPWAVGNCWS